MKHKWITHLDFIIGDMIALEFGHWLTVLCFGAEMDGRLLWYYRQLGFLLVFILFAVQFFTDGYRGILRRGYLKEAIAVCRQMLLLFAAEIVILFALQTSAVYSRRVLFLALFLEAGLVYLERCLLKYHLRGRFRKVKYARTLVIIASKAQAEAMIARLTDYPMNVFQIMGLAVTDRDMRGERVSGVLVTATLENVREFVTASVVDEVFISIPEDPKQEAELAREFLSIGLVAHICMEQRFEDLPCQRLERISEMNVLTCQNREVPLWMVFCKRIMDLAGGLVGTVLAVLVGIVVAPFIYIRSPGPVLFSQIRVGKNGRRFRIYKFRSMYMDAEERKKELMEQNKMTGHMFKIDGDPRILPGIGTFLRKTSLDEFPQFFNVLRGDMSLVGTRPPTVDEYEQYSFSHKKRLAMKPGITGVWQISGRSSIIDFEQVVRMDSEYIDHWTIEGDIKILFKTVAVVLSRRGSE